MVTVNRALAERRKRRALHLLLSPQDYDRPFGAPAGIPADRLATLRMALRQTLEDKAFLADADKAQIEIRYGPPEHIKSAIGAAFDAPAAVQDHAIEVLRKASR